MQILQQLPTNSDRLGRVQTPGARDADRRACTPFFVAMCFALGLLSAQGSCLKAASWFADFTDAETSTAELGLRYLLNHELTADGLLISTPTTTNPAAMLAMGLPKNAGWSMRTQARLMQDHGHFGPVTSNVLGCGTCVWGWVGPSSLGVGTPSGNESDSQDEFDPTVDDVVIQVDVFEGETKLWLWPADSLPATELTPIVESSYTVPVGYPGVWVRSDFGASALMIRNVTFSTEHIPIGPPIRGDFNRDGRLDVTDINLLTAVSAAASNDVVFDLNSDGAVTQADIEVWIHDLRNTWFGDANLDGQFDSQDFVDVFSTGKYELDATADWREGDWNGDGRFNSADFIAAFADGGYDRGQRGAVAAVPEPNCGFLAVIAGAATLLVRWRRDRA